LHYGDSRDFAGDAIAVVVDKNLEKVNILEVLTNF